MDARDSAFEADEISHHPYYNNRSWDKCQYHSRFCTIGARRKHCWQLKRLCKFVFRIDILFQRTSLRSLLVQLSVVQGRLEGCHCLTGLVFVQEIGESRCVRFCC